MLTTKLLYKQGYNDFFFYSSRPYVCSIIDMVRRLVTDLELYSTCRGSFHLPRIDCIQTIQTKSS